MTSPTPATPETTSVEDEIKAMGKIARVLDSVDRATADRIAGWLYDRYGADATPPETSKSPEEA